MKKIVITSTFRSFEGNVNDKMQELFLRSLKKQTYQNFVLVVTIFRERNVEQSVKSILGDKAVFVYSEIAEEYRYSLSKVVLNGIDYGTNNDCSILVDCSGDIILQKNLLETVNNHFTPMYSGISHPNIFYEINSRFNVINKSIGTCNRGIDIRFFDINLLNCEEVKKRLEKYILYDWGGMEHLLYGVSKGYSSTMINIFEESKVIKVENDRNLANENNGFIEESAKRNCRVLERLARNTEMDFDNLIDLFYIHTQYKMTKNKIRNFVYFKGEWKLWIQRKMKKKKECFKKMFA